MKKKILPMFFLLSLAMGLCIAVSGCSALKLKAPANLRVSDDGFLSWDEVDGAAAYRVFINDGVFDTDENRLDIFWLTDSYGEYLIDVVALDAKNRIKSESSELFEYDLQDSGGWTLQYNGESYDVAGTEDSKNVVSGKVILPSVYNDLPVTGIADVADSLLAQRHVDAGGKLQNSEGLGNIVVRPQIQSLYLVGLLPQRAEHDAGDLRIALLEFFEHVQSAAVGQHNIQKSHRGQVLIQRGIEIRHGVETYRVYVRHFQRAPYKLADTFVVFQQKNRSFHSSFLTFLSSGQCK